MTNIYIKYAIIMILGYSGLLLVYYADNNILISLIGMIITFLAIFLGFQL